MHWADRRVDGVVDSGVIGREHGATDADRDSPDEDTSDFFRCTVSFRRGVIESV